jgi:hypothetical protein
MDTDGRSRVCGQAGWGWHCPSAARWSATIPSAVYFTSTHVRADRVGGRRFTAHLRQLS